MLRITAKATSEGTMNVKSEGGKNQSVEELTAEFIAIFDAVCETLIQNGWSKMDLFKLFMTRKDRVGEVVETQKY